MDILNDSKPKRIKPQEAQKDLVPEKTTKKRKLTNDNNDDVQKKQKTNHDV